MRKVALIILDGWGMGEEAPHNAIYTARTPHFDQMWKRYPHTILQASGEYVGLPAGQIGGSEVGHLTIGAGRVIYQELVRINRALSVVGSEEYIENNIQFKVLVAAAKTKQLHLVGLLSTGGVHSHMQHLLLLLELLKKHGCMEPVIHFISDGRDTSPTLGLHFANQLLEKIEELNYGRVVTLSGRFYSMDRDMNMDRTERGIQLIVEAQPSSPYQSQLSGQTFAQNLQQAFELNYANAVGDEFIEPLLTDLTYAGVKDDDYFFFFNFRSDRMKQLISEISQSVLTDHIFTMTQYDKTYTYPILFHKQKNGATFPEFLSKRNLTQLRVAESEKYPHVTYFFNGGVEITFEGEVRHVVESNKVTHDQRPEMKADEIMKAVEDFTSQSLPDFVLVNFANPDMVGHTGNYDAVISGVQTVDRDLGKLCDFLTEHEYICCVTADHGNADIMYDPITHEVHTAHTMNPVPFIVVDTKDPNNQRIVLDQHFENSLALIAGTLVELMEIEEQPFQSLIVK